MEKTNNFMEYFIILEKRAKYHLNKRYNKPLYYYDKKIINDILYNEKSHYVEIFKEYLIYEDNNEFLKKYYKSKEMTVKYQKILFFYDKYTKIYANYTALPESKYLYKNIKRKQKMINQMQNLDKNTKDEEEEEESNEDVSNTVFSSRVINSIYNKTSSTCKNNISQNSERSINDFLGKINIIENKMNKKNNIHKEGLNKGGLYDLLCIKPKTSIKNFIISSRHKESNNNKNKIIFESKNNITNNNSSSNLNINQNKISSSKILFISSMNSYMNKTKNHLVKNNGIVKNINKLFRNISNSKLNSTNILNYQKQKNSTNQLKNNQIKHNSNNITKENVNLTNINNYSTNLNNSHNNHIYNLSRTFLKYDKILLSSTSNSPKMLHQNMLSSPNNKKNISFKPENQKKELKKELKKEYNSKSTSKIFNTKIYQVKLLEKQKCNSFNHRKKKFNKNINNINDNNSKLNYFKKAKTYRNYTSKILSTTNNNTNSNKSKIQNNINKKLMFGIKYNSQRIVNAKSPINPITNYYFQSFLKNRKKNRSSLIKKKIINNFNIINNINDNSTQINIYTGKELYKSLHSHSNSIYNNSNFTPGNVSRSPSNGALKIKHKGNSNGLLNSPTYISKNKILEKKPKNNLYLKKMIYKKLIENEKSFITDRKITEGKLFEKLEYYKKICEKKSINNLSKNYNKRNINECTKGNDYKKLINKIFNKNSNSNKILKTKTYNNSPVRCKFNPKYLKNNKSPTNECSSPKIIQQNKANNSKEFNRKKLYQNYIISDLKEMKNIGIDDVHKLFLHSERNNNFKISFK